MPEVLDPAYGSGLIEGCIGMDAGGEDAGGMTSIKLRGEIAPGPKTRDFTETVAAEARL